MDNMDTIRRFTILFSLFYISAIVLVVIYMMYFSLDDFEILTPIGVIIVLMLIVLCCLTDRLLSERKKNFSEIDANPTSDEPFFDTN